MAMIATRGERTFAGSAVAFYDDHFVIRGRMVDRLSSGRVVSASSLTLPGSITGARDRSLPDPGSDAGGARWVSWDNQAREWLMRARCVPTIEMDTCGVQAMGR